MGDTSDTGAQLFLSKNWEKMMSDFQFTRDQLRTVRDEAHRCSKDFNQIAETLSELDRVDESTIAYYEGKSDGIDDVVDGIDDVLAEYDDIISSEEQE